MANSTHISTYVRLGGLLLLAGFAATPAIGCSSKPRPSPLAGDDKVLAEVNGTTITKYDVRRQALDAFGPEVGARITSDTERKLLESLVQTRAMAQMGERELSVVEKAELDKRVAAYREQLLVKKYLAKRARPAKVSEQAVRDYYARHASSFGGRKVKAYELITSTAQLDAAQRGAALAALAKAGEQQDWNAWAPALAAAGQPLVLRKGEDDAAMLDPKVRQLISPLAVGKTSQVTLIDGRPYVARVTAEREVPPRPLAEVRDQIVEALTPVQLRDAVKRESAKALKSSEVAYR